MKRIFLLTAYSLLLMASLPAHAGSGTSLNVPIGDPTYEMVDKLAASGLIKTPIYGQRPWTRLYVAKLTDEAQKNKGKLENALEHDLAFKTFSRRLGHKRFIDAILSRLTAEYKDELEALGGEATNFRIHPLKSISHTYTYLDNNPSVVPQNGLGSIDAVVHPLVANRQGRQYEKGHHFYWETEHSAQITPYFAAYARPQFQFRFPNDGNEQTHAYMHNLYAKTGWRNIELEVGRDQMLWGEGLHGGLMFSDNARGLDMIKVSTPYPFRLPWVFEHLGQWRGTAIIANLGHDYAPQDPWVIGYRIDLKPFEWWDIGFAHITEMGGKGYELPSTGSIIGEFSGIATKGGDPGGGKPTNRQLSIDSRFVLQKLRGFTLYGEGFMEDKNAELGLLFFHDMAWLAGAYLPRLDYTGKWSLRLEYEHIGEIPYHHGEYRSGWTLNKIFLGNIMGPDSNKAMTTIAYHFTPISIISGNFGFLHRSGNTYAHVVSNADITDVVRATDGPEEYHFLNSYSLAFPIKKHMEINTSIGWDYVYNASFIQGNKKADFMTEIGLTMKFPEF